MRIGIDRTCKTLFKEPTEKVYERFRKRIE